MTFIPTLRSALIEAGNPEHAEGARAYMRDQFEYYGIYSARRTEIQKAIIKQIPPPSDRESLNALIRELWEDEYRDMNYTVFELAKAWLKLAREEDLELIEWLIRTRSWWDTVDWIAPHIVEPFFKKFPHLVEPTCNRWIEDEYFWLQRAAIIFQLLRKKNTDEGLLFRMIRRRMHEKEFFIRKAIGWALRQYSRVAPDTVIAFVEQEPLHSLSKREALKWMERKSAKYSADNRKSK